MVDNKKYKILEANRTSLLLRHTTETNDVFSPGCFLFSVPTRFAPRGTKTICLLDVGSDKACRAGAVVVAQLAERTLSAPEIRVQILTFTNLA